MGEGDVSPLREAAISMHEMYEELKASGFTRGEAMELVSRILVGTFNAEQQNRKENGEQ